MTVQIRSARWEDAAAVDSLYNRASRAQYGTEDSTVEDVLRHWRLPSVKLESDVAVAVDDAGVVVGCGDIYVEGDRHERIWLYVCGEGARELIADLERRGSDRAAGAPAFFRAYVPSADHEVRTALGAAGYTPVRHSFRMVAELDEELPAPDWPDGVTVRTFDRARDERAVYDVQQETFADMWEHMPAPFEEWQHWMFSDAERHDPSLWFLVEADGELTGIALCRPFETGDPEMGWVSVLGVRSPWRRRGIALALLRHAFREFHARGRRRVGLGVDGEGETGALRLYERAGMQVARRYETLERRP